MTKEEKNSLAESIAIENRAECPYGEKIVRAALKNLRQDDLKDICRSMVIFDWDLDTIYLADASRNHEGEMSNDYCVRMWNIWEYSKGKLAVEYTFYRMEKDHGIVMSRGTWRGVVDKKYDTSEEDVKHMVNGLYINLDNVSDSIRNIMKLSLESPHPHLESNEHYVDEMLILTWDVAIGCAEHSDSYGLMSLARVDEELSSVRELVESTQDSRTLHMPNHDYHFSLKAGQPGICCGGPVKDGTDLRMLSRFLMPVDFLSFVQRFDAIVPDIEKKLREATAAARAEIEKGQS